MTNKIVLVKKKLLPIKKKRKFCSNNSNNSDNSNNSIGYYDKNDFHQSKISRYHKLFITDLKILRLIIYKGGG